MIENEQVVEAADPPVFIPTEEWIDAYEAQATDELYAKAARYAANRAAQVERAGGRVDDLYIESLVQDAFVDTWTGQLAWDPSRASLEQQVINAITSRSRHDRERAASRRHVSLDGHATDREARQTVAAVEAALAANRSCVETATECATRSLAELRSLAQKDRDVLAILDAYDQQAYARRDVLTATKLSARRYRNARYRLGSYVQQLPHEIQQLARMRA